MNAALQKVFEATLALFKQDGRVLAAYMIGSVGTEKEDDVSDVDPVFVVRADQFDAFDEDLRGSFERVGVKPILWWPERINCDTLRNYAVLFEADGRLLQYDITIEAADRDRRRKIKAAQLLFDKAGALEIVEESPDGGFNPDRLRWTVELFWVYAYIHGKYLQRADTFKLIAAQQELFHAHLEILRALQGDGAKDWWPLVANRVCGDGNEDALRVYFQHTDRDSIAQALPRELERFSKDARAACKKWNVEYPEVLENKIREHIDNVLMKIR